MSEEKDPVSGSAPPKFSRYRSVRYSKPPPEPEPEPLPVAKESDISRTKSMSRYRRSRIVSSKPEPVPTLRSPPVPEIPSSLIPPARLAARRVTEPQQQQRAQETQQTRQETDEEKAKRMVRELQEKEARARRELREIEQQRRIAEQKTKEAEAEKAKAVEGLLAGVKHTEVEWKPVKMEVASPPRTPKKDMFGSMFLRKKTPPGKRPVTSIGNSSRGVSPQPSSGNETSTSRERLKISGPLELMDPLRSHEPLKSQEPLKSIESSRSSEPPPNKKPSRSNEAPKVIEQGGGGIVPQTDAPISASNAGERRVLVRCKQSSITLPVTPETTPVDIIYSAANIMTQNIIPSTAILLESYTHLGLERRVRRYEHVRDIMNSWDRDTQNAFVLTNSDTPRFDTDLEIKSVSRDAPPTVTVYMYHSQKPGRWNKLYVTLMSTGQMFVSKKPESKLNGKNVITICHLSDFDIYIPTPQQLRKTVKPPKKKCYAIKSQQKTTMFLSTENFVHFFSTDDEELGEKFYNAVQNWRSWYLVSRMGGSNKKIGAVIPKQQADPITSLSKDDSPYTIGSFQPLLNMDRFNSPKEDEEDDDEDVPRQIPFHLRNSVSFPSRQESKRHPPPVTYRLPPEAEEEFASNSLLGRSYTQRQREAQTSRLAVTNRTEERTLSMKSSKSMRVKPKPLLDFTPTFKEPPQWDKTGKGHGVKASEGKLLVEKANTPSDFAIPGDLPSTTMFRRPTTGVPRSPTGVRPKTGVSGDAEGPFVKGGLISGGNGTGR